MADVSGGGGGAEGKGYNPVSLPGLREAGFTRIVR